MDYETISTMGHGYINLFRTKNNIKISSLSGYIDIPSAPTLRLLTYYYYNIYYNNI